MSREILKCPNCNSYTLKEKCPSCQTPTLSPKPAKFSPEDRFGSYRRLYKKEQAL